MDPKSLIESKTVVLYTDWPLLCRGPSPGIVSPYAFTGIRWYMGPGLDITVWVLTDSKSLTISILGWDGDCLAIGIVGTGLV